MPDGDPRLVFVSQSPQAVTFSYFDLPDNTHVVFVDKFNKVSGDKALLSGSGSLTVVTSGLKTGDYYLSARVDDEHEVARTVKFHVAGG